MSTIESPLNILGTLIEPQDGKAQIQADEEMGTIQELLRIEIDTKNVTVVKPNATTNEPVDSVTFKLPQFSSNLPIKDVMEQITEEVEEFSSVPMKDSRVTPRTKMLISLPLPATYEPQMMETIEEINPLKTEDNIGTGHKKTTSKTKVNHERSTNIREETSGDKGAIPLEKSSSIADTKVLKIKKFKRPYCFQCQDRITPYSLNVSLRPSLNISVPHCNLCAKTFTCQAYLSAHIKTHNKESGFTCDICNMAFARKVQFDNHMTSHSGEKYMCEFCKKRFSTRKCVHDHIRTHGNQTYICTYCHASFSRQTSLNRHLDKGCKKHESKSS